MEADEPALGFGQAFIDIIPHEVLKSYIHCNRGAFVLLDLLNLDIPEVSAKIRSSLIGTRTSLSEKKYKGAELLLQKLKSGKINNLK